MKLITPKQKELIIKLKSFCDNKDFGNPLDNVNLDAFTIGDASTLIKGLLGLQNATNLHSVVLWFPIHTCSNARLMMCLTPSKNIKTNNNSPGQPRHKFRNNE